MVKYYRVVMVFVLLLLSCCSFGATQMDKIDKLEKEYILRVKSEAEQFKSALNRNKKSLEKKLKRLKLNYTRRNKRSRVKRINSLLIKLKKGTLDAALNGEEEKEIKEATIPIFNKENVPQKENNIKKIPRIKTKEDLIRMMKKCNPSFFGHYDIQTHNGNITRVSFQHCGIIDIRPLANLKNLKHINLRGNPLSDISPLRRLRKLKNINLDNTFVSDISVLKNTPLESVSIANTPISDLSPLSRKLVYLSLQGCLFIKSMAPVSKMKELRELILPPHFYYFKIKFIKRLKQLQVLDIRWRDNKEKTSTAKFLKEHQGNIE
jgi:hypothetical protein